MWYVDVLVKSSSQNDAKGAVVAEGDLLGLSIRLFSQLLLGRCTLDIPPVTESLLAQHAHGLIAENEELLHKLVIIAAPHLTRSYFLNPSPLSKPLDTHLPIRMRRRLLPQAILDVRSKYNAYSDFLQLTKSANS
ncbi:hypothetical protein BDZ89DRAFT_1079376 [Hymenopellis radicata]|nr:hypothetical protein BDZ89DRAFT_1079376 [Hymenopellis radicata]